jgi:hypothetical protein
MTAKPIEVTIRSSDGGVDAPTVHDLLGQVEDFVRVLEGVEEAMAGDEKPALIWRVTNATKNSPLTLEITPYPEDLAINIDRRVVEVERAAIGGLHALQTGVARPMYFTDKVMNRARCLHARVQNGLAETVIKVDKAVARSPLVLNRSVADTVQKHARLIEDKDAIPYKELGSIEGFIASVELDGRHRAVLTLRARINGEIVKAFARDRAFQQLERIKLGDVWSGARVRVFGLLHFRRLGVIEHIDATNVEMLDIEQLPSMDEIVDPTFTGGLTTEEFLERLRNE